jgi:DNA repair photolyase
MPNTRSMRWSELTVEAEEQRRLPGYREQAAIRTFDAPEALDVRFYEVQAKSVLNRVPKASRMPFRWTINAYRGCTHACRYCLRGDTPILMADGRTKKLADIKAGDWIYGTARGARYRHYTATQVLDHWQTRKHVYRVRLEDGTELFASGDHRFLTRRGWKHVAGSERGRWRRPHLTLNSKLIGTGAFAVPPVHCPEYRRGYLCGLLRGDGHVSYRAGAKNDQIKSVRLALTDLEALARAKGYLTQLGVESREFLFQASGHSVKPMRAISSCIRDGVAAVEDVLAWPRDPSEDWCRGFLAGIYDAEGSFGGGPGGGVVRIANTDPAIIDWTTYCLRRIGCSYIVEPRPGRNGLCYVRLLGGLSAQLHLFQACDPAITRKRVFEGTALKSDAQLRVVSIDRMGICDLYDITTGTGDFIANGVVSHNCFARPTHTYLDFNAGRDFEREIVVKVNAPEVARAELMRPKWTREHVAMGTNTDPYQWVESRYRLMPGIWEALRDSATPCSVLTKSPLLLRDKELMLEVAERAPVAANLSVPTIDEKAWRATEPHTPHPMKRLEAVAELTRAGIPTGILIAPLMPGINDQPEQVERILELAAEAGAVDVGGIALHLRGEVKDLWFDWLRDNRPDLLPRYERLYARGAYAPQAERDRLAALAKPRGRRSPRTGRGPEAAPAERDPAGGAPEPGAAARSAPEQQTLF